MIPRSVKTAVVSALTLGLAAVASEPTFLRQSNPDRRLGAGTPNIASTIPEEIVVKDGTVFQTGGCPQVIPEQKALLQATDSSIPGNIITLGSEGNGRAGNHFMVISDFFAMGYCCRSKVLRMPKHDKSFPSGVLEAGGQFETEKRFFDFSGVDTMPLEEYEGLYKDPLICKPHMDMGNKEAMYLLSIHDDLLSCMRRVYLRGCEAAYLEPLLDAEKFSYCDKPAATTGRQSSDDNGRQDPGIVPHRDAQSTSVSEAALDGRGALREAGGNEGELLALQAQNDGGDSTMMSRVGKRGSAGSLVVHIRSGDIFRSFPPNKAPTRGFHSFGQPPLQFYLHAIASQPWSDVTILTYNQEPRQLNPTFGALQMLQQMGMLGPNVTTHMDRDLLTDIRAMLCADGLAISRSTLHFLTFAHSRAKHLMIPSECGPGWYARGLKDERSVEKHGIRKKPNPNNTTLLCIEKPDTEVYGVDWKVDEASYLPYVDWDASPVQRLEMLTFDGVKGLARCCAG